MFNKHLQTTYMWSISDADCIIRQWALPDLSEDSNCTQYKIQYFRGIMHYICFFMKINHFAPKENNNHCGWESGQTSIYINRWHAKEWLGHLISGSLQGTPDICFRFRNVNIPEIVLLTVLYWIYIGSFNFLLLIKLWSSSLQVSTSIRIFYWHLWVFSNCEHYCEHGNYCLEQRPIF